MRGGREGGIDRCGVAEMKIERNVSRHVVIKKRSAFAHCFAGRHHGGQWIDVDLDRFGRVLGRKHRLGDDAGDRIADIAHLVFGERAAPRLFQRRAVAALERHIAFERAVALEVSRGIDREHARHLAGRIGVDGADHPMSVAASHHHRISLAGQADIVGVAAVAAQQHRILDARHRLPDGKFLDRQLPRGQSFIGAFGRLIQIHDRAIPPGFRQILQAISANHAHNGLGPARQAVRRTWHASAKSAVLALPLVADTFVSI